MNPFAFGRVRRELEQWQAAERTPTLWWRDDDARAATPALERLLNTARGAPICLAVVPDGDLAGLAARLAGQANVTVVQHGVDHVDRGAPGGPRTEVAADRTTDEIAAGIAAGRRRMVKAGLDPVAYAPPFNHIDRRTAGAASLAGYGLFTAGSARPDLTPGTGFAATDLDVLRWKGRPRFKGRDRLLGELAAAMARRRLEGRTDAVGLLTHHLDHDAGAWRFLDWFVGWAGGRFVWVDIVAAAAPVNAKPRGGGA